MGIVTTAAAVDMKNQIHVAALTLVLILTGTAVEQTTNIPSSKTTAGPGGVPEALIALEQGFWSAEKNKEGGYFQHHLAHESITIDFSGAKDKSEILQAIKTSSCRVKSYSLGRFTTKVLAMNTFLLTYRADQQVTCLGRIPPDHIYASSIYVKEAGRFQRVFHQETPRMEVISAKAIRTAEPRAQREVGKNAKDHLGTGELHSSRTQDQIFSRREVGDGVGPVGIAGASKAAVSREMRSPLMPGS